MSRLQPVTSTDDHNFRFDLHIVCNSTLTLEMTSREAVSVD
jgi:hypothetical protein